MLEHCRWPCGRCRAAPARTSSRRSARRGRRRTAGPLRPGSRDRRQHETARGRPGAASCAPAGPAPARRGSRRSTWLQRAGVEQHVVALAPAHRRDAATARAPLFAVSRQRLQRILQGTGLLQRRPRDTRDRDQRRALAAASSSEASSPSTDPTSRSRRRTGLAGTSAIASSPNRPPTSASTNRLSAAPGGARRRQHGDEQDGRGAGLHDREPADVEQSGRQRGQRHDERQLPGAAADQPDQQLADQDPHRDPDDQVDHDPLSLAEPGRDGDTAATGAKNGCTWPITAVAISHAAEAARQI